MGDGGGVAANQVISLPGADVIFADCTAEGEGLWIPHLISEAKLQL